jgi:hypothetical protein
VNICEHKWKILYVHLKFKCLKSWSKWKLKVIKSIRCGIDDEKRERWNVSVISLAFVLNRARIRGILRERVGDEQKWLWWLNWIIKGCDFKYYIFYPSHIELVEKFRLKIFARKKIKLNWFWKEKLLCRKLIAGWLWEGASRFKNAWNISLNTCLMG